MGTPRNALSASSVASVLRVQLETAPDRNRGSKPAEPFPSPEPPGGSARPWHGRIANRQCAFADETADDTGHGYHATIFRFSLYGVQ